jgi:mxaC protein
MTFDFLNPWMLALLPIGLLPLLRRRGDALPFSCVAWLPRDPVGETLYVLWRATAVIAISSIIVGLAGPGVSGESKPVNGRGADILILMDRSASMDNPVSRGVVDVGGAPPPGESKNHVARDAITRFISHRDGDRFAFMLFGTHPLFVMPFTQNHTAIDAAMAATGIARGMPDTLLGSGLSDAVDAFDGRSRRGNRAIILVSDGGARLDAAAQQRIRDGLSRNHIALYFIYLRSGVYSPDLHAIAPSHNYSAEAELHRYFLTLQSPYHLYQADDAEQVASAMADIERHENVTASYLERLPRQARSAWCFAAALACCVALLGFGLVQKRSWA